EDGSGNGGVYSMLKTDTTPTPSIATLYQNSTSNGLFGTLKESTATLDKAYINVFGPGGSVSLREINVDGSNPADLSNEYVACGELPSPLDLTGSPNDVTPAYLVLATRAGANDTLQILDPNTGSATLTLGTISNTVTPDTSSRKAAVCAVDSFSRY